MTSTLPIPPLHFSVGTICLGGSAADAPIEVTRCYGLQRPNGLNILLSIAIERLGQTSRKGAAVFLDYFALGVLVFVVVTLFYAPNAHRPVRHWPASNCSKTLISINCPAALSPRSRSTHIIGTTSSSSARCRCG